MHSRLPYTPCKLYYDGWAIVKEGSYLRTVPRQPWRKPSAYLITAVKPSRKRPGRVNLVCLRWPPEEIPKGAIVHPLQWYPRRKKARRLSDLHRPPHLPEQGE